MNKIQEINIVIFHYLIFKKSKQLKRTISNSESRTIDLSYELNDKFNSNKALIIGHGLFGSKVC